MLKLKYVILLALLFVFGAMPSSAATAATTTTLTIAPGPTVNAGTPVTLSVTVIDDNPLPVPRGQVLFCDATAARCADAALFGSSQLSVGGTASLKLTLGVGTYSIVAQFVGVVGAAPSVSTPQSLTVTGTAGYLSSTTISPSGSVGSYTLTGAVTAFGRPPFSGNITFFDDAAHSNAQVGAPVALDPATLGFTLLASPTLATGNSPVRTVVADFDGDGIPDVAVANFADATVSIFLGKGDGTFKPPTIINTAASPFGLLAADFNGDGKIDLAVSNGSSSTVSVFLGNGDGTFTEEPTLSPYALGTNSARSLAAADFDGDGNIDLAVLATTSGAGFVLILQGHGDGTFTIQQTGCPDGCANITYPVGTSPNQIAAADLNHDGAVDLLATDDLAGTLSILRGNGDLTFNPRTILSLATDLEGLAVGDFNGDGFPDVAVTSAGGGSVTVLLNDNVGSGALTAQSPALSAGGNPSDVVAVDFNHDGRLDLAVVNQLDGTVGFFLGNGDGTFQGQKTAAIGSQPFALSAGDFNGDGLPDLVASNSTDNTLSIRLSAQTESATESGISVPGGGTHNVLASYPGDSARASSVSVTTPLTGLTVTTTTLTAVPAASSVFGQSVTFTATVAPPPGSGPAFGTVSFVNNPVGGPVTLNTANVDATGTATFTTSTLAVASYSLTAVYSGNADSAASTSALTPYTVAKTNTSTSVTSSLNPSVSGQAVTFTATVSAVAPGAGTPTGLVTFLTNGSSIGTGTLSAGVATLITPNVPVGSQTITTSYSGSNSFNGSTGSLTGNPQVVNPANTTLALTSSVNPSVFGQRITFSANVSVLAPGGGGPSSGTVTFFDNGTMIGSGALGDGPATFSISTLAVGNHPITATFGGNASFNGSTGTLTGNPQVVSKATTTTVLTTSASPSTFGQSVTLTATISTAATGTITGTVTFKSGTTVIGAPVAVSGGTAVLMTTALPSRTQNLTAVYSGDTNFNTSTSAPVSFTVNPAASTTVLTTSASPSTFGASVTLTATITPIPTGASLGSVNFFNGATNIGSGNVNASGVATLSTAALPVGVLSLTAAYSGNANFATSTSVAVSFTVNKAATTTALAVSPNPVIAGQTVTLTATITPTPTGAPLGTVDFFNGATNIGTSNVNASGVATLSTAALPQGTLSLTATYSGNVNFATSTSPAQSLVVVTATATALTAAPNPSTFGQSVTLTATVTPTPTGASFGTVNFFNGATMVGTSNVNASGVATFSSTTLPVGTLSLTAVYSGNAAFGTSTSSGFSLTVNVAPTTTTLAASPSPGTFGQSITLTATIAPVPSGAALGTVNFFNGATNIGTGNVNASGVATLAVTTLPAGNLTLTAVYSGSASFGPSTSAGLALTVNTTFAVNAPITSFLVVEGGSVPITINVPPLGGAFNNAVIMSATGLPPGATGTFVPPAVTPGAVGATTVLTIQLAPLAANASKPGSETGVPVPAFAFVAGLLLFIRRKHLRRSLRLAALFMLVTLLGSTLAGCAGGFLRPPSTPPGAFMVTITGTSGTTVNSTTVAVVVR
jgi:hypothetical protein